MPLTESESKIYDAMIVLYGIDAQVNKMEEELIELLHATKEFKKDPSPENEKSLICELVDAHLMIVQIAKYYDWNEFMNYRDIKINKHLPEKIRSAADKNSNAKYLLEKYYPEFLALEKAKDAPITYMEPRVRIKED